MQRAVRSSRIATEFVPWFPSSQRNELNTLAYYQIKLFWLFISSSSAFSYLSCFRAIVTCSTHMCSFSNCGGQQANSMAPDSKSGNFKYISTKVATSDAAWAWPGPKMMLCILQFFQKGRFFKFLDRSRKILIYVTKLFIIHRKKLVVFI